MRIPPSQIPQMTVAPPPVDGFGIAFAEVEFFARARSRLPPRCW